MNKTGRVIKQHISEFPDPLIVKKGELLEVEDRLTEWDGWLFCRTPYGISGWAPHNYVERNGNTGIMLRDYDASELNVSVGEILEIILEESGWYQCRTEYGRPGWVPVENIEIID